MPDALCDGCGQPTGEEHLARRIRRLELASRFRPIHIQILFLANCPPPRLEDYFYFANPDRSARTGLSRVLFDELMNGLGISQAVASNEEQALTEFQKRGYSYAHALECPFGDAFPDFRRDKPEYSGVALAHRYGPTVVKRITLSYKPRHIVLLFARSRYLIPYLEQASLRERLLLHQNLPLHFPHPDNPAAQVGFRSGLADVLNRAATRPMPA
jgi:hypothetical protein